MMELGDFSKQFHQQLADHVIDAKIDHVIMVGDEMRALAGELGRKSANSLGFVGSFAHCDSPADAIAALDDFGLAHGDAVLVKGSNSVGLGKLVQFFTQGGG